MVFVTGQQEVNVLCAKLRRTFPNGGEETDGQTLPLIEPEAKKKRDKKFKKNDEDRKETMLKNAPQINLNK